MKSRMLIVRQFIILILLLSSALGCATIQRNIAESNARAQEQYDRNQQQREAENAKLKIECPNIELMGLFTKDMRPMSPLIIYFAKIRNGSNLTRIVTIEWLDMYGQAMTSTNEIGAGQIVTTQLSANSPRDRQPMDLRITSCR
jgi:hypothetical protein